METLSTISIAVPIDNHLIMGELGRAAMRIESSVTSLSWIPQGAVEGFFRLPFELGVAHYDPPRPEVLGDLDELQASDRFRFVNRLEAWIEVQDGSIVDTGQAGGGRINVTKVRYGPTSIALTPVVMPELRREPEFGSSSAVCPDRRWDRRLPHPPAGSATSPTSRSGDQ
jgi:hypothetical protein